MRKFLAKGGYGEHGRSCFLVEYGTEGHFYMVDCGIMDSDSNPYPNVFAEELELVDYLFLTHCHKDHSGAFEEMLKRGFHGVLVTTGMTARLSGISYPQTVLLEVTDHDLAVNQAEIGPFLVHYGRTGHCPGGLWFLIEDDMGKCLFTGDYQEHPLAYACDPVKNCTADLAVVDCAHRDTMETADGLRKQMKDQIRNFRNLGQKILFPLPHYGRGCEILFLLDEMKRDERAGWRIAADQRFIKDLETVLAEEIWYQEAVYEQLKQIYEELRQSYHGIAEPENQKNWDIYLMGDPHLQKEENQELVKAQVEKGTAVIITGRVKPGHLPELLLKGGKAIKQLYPHHQSERDMENMVRNNQFQVVVPFHNERKELYF